MAKKAPQETRSKLLYAAIALIEADGLGPLTLDRVAQKAQVSKGGLLHHFPTKESLLLGIVELVGEKWTERVEQELAQEEAGSIGRWARAYVRATFDRTDFESQLMVVLGHLVAANPEFAGACDGIYTDIFKQIEDDPLPEARRLVIQIACDGLWWSELKGYPYLEETSRAAMRAELLRLTYDARNDQK